MKYVIQWRGLKEIRYEGCFDTIEEAEATRNVRQSFLPEGWHGDIEEVKLITPRNWSATFRPYYTFSFLADCSALKSKKGITKNNIECIGRKVVADCCEPEVWTEYFGYSRNKIIVGLEENDEDRAKQIIVDMLNKATK